MRAVTLDAFDAAPAVRDDLPDPTAAAGGLVVGVRALGHEELPHGNSGPGRRATRPRNCR